MTDLIPYIALGTSLVATGLWIGTFLSYGLDAKRVEQRLFNAELRLTALGKLHGEE
jgi:hypothetical protein